MVDTTADAAGQVWRTARRGADRVRLDLAKAYADLARAYEDAGRAGVETGEAISDAAQIALAEARRRVKPMRATIGDHPLAALGAAATAGIVLGLLLARR